MIIDYGSFAYFLYPCGAFVVLAILALVLKRFSPRVQKTVIMIITLINLFQHLFKFAIYPQYKGTSFSNIETAYNMCATLIITFPFALMSKRNGWKDFVCCAGVIAGLLTMFMPIWYIGKPGYGWDIFRFYFCHILLMYSGALPLILGVHHLSWKNWYKYPLFFVLYLFIILLNEILAVYLGLTSGTPETLHETLYALNPLWMMHPTEQFAWLEALLDPITPDILFSDGNYVPILWYAYPMCILFAVVGFIVGAVGDRKNFVKDFRRYGSNIAKRWKKLKGRFKKESSSTD